MEGIILPPVQKPHCYSSYSQRKKTDEKKKRADGLGVEFMKYKMWDDLFSFGKICGTLKLGKESLTEKEKFGDCETRKAGRYFIGESLSSAYRKLMKVDE